MARGGKRTGAPGVAYPNRTDLNTAPSGDTYGDKKQMQDRMDAVPLKPAPTPPRPITPPAPLDRPTERPNEPIQAGLPMGPGAGPEVLGLADSALDELRAVYLRYPSEEIRELIEAMEEGR